jgi:hypothetical protein
VRHTFARVDVPELFSHRDLYDEVRQGEGDFRNEHAYQNEHPRPLPRDERKRREQDSVEESLAAWSTFDRDFSKLAGAEKL